MLDPQSFIDHKDQFIQLVQQGALVFCNHSGGKDSQAMYLLLRRYVPRKQLVIIHADLGNEVEWDGVKEHIRATTDARPLELAYAYWNTGKPKDLLGYIEQRGMWPSKGQRYCTSDLKRGPIQREIRRICAEHFGDDAKQIAINCMGLRSAESTERSKLDAWQLNKDLTVNKRKDRTVYDFNCILSMTEKEVFQAIDDAGQKPHPMYAKGLGRLSCSFCIFACDKQLKIATETRPELAQKYVNLEAKIGHTFRHKKSLAEITGLQPTN